MKPRDAILTLTGHWPTCAELAADLGVNVNRVLGWRYHRSIPARYLVAICEAAQRRGYAEVTLEALAGAMDYRQDAQTVRASLDSYAAAA